MVDVKMEELINTRNLKLAAMVFSFLGFTLGPYLMLQEARMLEEMGLIKKEAA